MKITLVCVGKMKQTYLKEAMNDYIKQMPYPFEIVEVQDEKEITGMGIEEKRILSKIGSQDFVIGLAIKGEMISSEQFALKLDHWMTYEKKDLTFIIGGSYGFTQAIYDRCNYLLSFSKMTFPHQLMRVILVEQIYRGFQILKGHPYHK
ncbi:23S rRNA (pseudouridine(1915)-N(3))-methyltransferase RlmH [Acholeplasma vituli]|uniref:Ribosomal RNA large subunit methyltransferase H n=1 Tax=Paracholeplasma vituli TaxID=69473 RepID=A0ABT2PU34_9MOLU|nr:23S rRNA (pseudouridine(1915)-N(3))-methyltransferase RlmH [Paracholeplasma vituli]MCU0104360.1 23S rRNA (pseudouridine(1915)-N(3))-methyltransferase RlmH [Paracholeplasma vituli]